MDIQTLTSFFMWCTILNGGLLVWAILWCVLAPDFTYRIQSRFLSIGRDAFNTTIYAFIGAFKLFFLVFNLVPFLALSIIR